MVTFHHVCSEVLLVFKQIYTVLSGVNTSVTVCLYSVRVEEWGFSWTSMSQVIVCLLVL